MKKLFFLMAIMSLYLFNYGWSWEAKYLSKINIAEGALYQSASFVVLENGDLLFTDIRDKKAQLKIFNEDGQVIRAWGQLGPGPEEFGGLGFPDYQKPYLAVSDAGKHRIHIFEKLSNYEFKKIAEILAWEQNGNIKIYDKNILITGVAISSEGKKYLVFMRGFSGRNTRYLLPVEYTYGHHSKGEYEKVNNEVSGIYSLSFIDVCEDFAYHVSDVRLKVAKINLRSEKIEFFGQEPENFRRVVLNKKLREDLLRAPEIVEEIMTKNSFVGGIFADRDFVGVIYLNREKKISETLYYAPYLQVYDRTGKLLYEQPLTPFYSEERIVPLYYQKDNRLLYLCSIIYGVEHPKYVIYKYQIKT
ncbi:MAG: hypothetical protein HPY46_09675 [Candidatus Aminicenantes bacterium]|uniref:6-bladed beta-propeller n=1 Tax=Candidatus Saccharicenans subterraneus TaxID=2508984 RepID=A0A3E2BJN0_9BACT|nr:hypothetical protein [Candidatus Aminicenantes bacterium]RFT14940.1 MAG: hypothetical protein OP8BY_1450 [Candidatus Saccharicenans subterraneum]